MDIYGRVHLEVKFILSSTLVVNLVQMESFYLFLSKIHTKALQNLLSFYFSTLRQRILQINY